MFESAAALSRAPVITNDDFSTGNLPAALSRGPVITNALFLSGNSDALCDYIVITN